MDRIILAAALLLAAAAVSAATSTIPLPKPAKSDALVGAYYFPGWCKENRWYCIAASETAQHPLLGYYREGDPETADWHIKWALEHGVSFFAFDYYTRGGSQMLETALDDGFLKSRFIKQFKFCINWCNHAPSTEMTADELRRFGDLVIGKYLTHPSYLKIDGKPVVMILVGNGFVVNLGVEQAKVEFDRFEQRCKDAGLPGVYLVFCEGAIGSAEDVQRAKQAGADAFCRYNYPYSGTGVNGPGTHAEFPYTQLMEQGEQEWKHWRTMAEGDFWPTVMPGWDRRPWTKYDDVVYTGGTPELFGKFLAKAGGYLSKDRIVMIECWNEWGEGSVLEPSVEHGFGYLDQVRKAFCPKAGPHKDVNPKIGSVSGTSFRNTGRAGLALPSIDTWRFDFDTEGWTASSLSDFRQEWGVISGVTTTKDPQLNSPATYLNCANYKKLRIRMRATPVTFAGKEASGQVFWSTIEKGMCGEQSLQFPVMPDGEWRQYDICLPAAPNWKGRIDGIRVDPVDVEGVRVEIDEIRFVR